MFRGIVFGDLWGIEEGVWVQLWSGAVGAIFSAAAAAAVAVMVLARSNAHQRKLASEALEHQKILGEQQLAEQKAEAARVREQAAIAEVIITAERFIPISRGSLNDVNDHLVVFQSAVARWRVELGVGSPLTDELLKWTTLHFVAARNRAAARSHGENEQADIAFGHLSKAVTSLSTLALGWARADQPLKDAILIRSAKLRSEIDMPLTPLADSPPEL